MDNLQKLNDNLEKLGAQVSDLRSVGDIFARIKELAHAYKSVVAEIQSGSENLRAMLKMHQGFQLEAQRHIDSIERKLDVNNENVVIALNDKMRVFETQQTELRKELTKTFVELEGLTKKVVSYYYYALGLFLLNAVGLAFVVYIILFKKG